MGRGWRAVVHPDDIARLTRRASKARRLHSGFDVDMRVRHQDGTWRWMLNSARPRFSPEGVFMGHVGSVIDINDRKRTEAELALAQHRLTAALDGSDVGVWEFDFVTGKLWLSEGAMGIGGEVEGQPLRNGLIQWQEAVHPDDMALLANAFEEFMAGTITKMECEIRVRGGDGNWIWVINRGTAVESDAEGRPLRVAGTVTDIDERRRAEDRLKWTADHDLLTGLANRGLFRRRLDAALTELKADIAMDRVPPARLAVALLDLDHFKQVNDHFGHATGDAMLVAMAQRLEGFIGATETAARLGGDEFTLILRDFVTDEALKARLDGLSELLRQPIEIDGHDFACGASIGVTLAPEDGLDVASMLKNADKAMYRAKAAGRGVAMMFSTDDKAEAAGAVAGATAAIA
jgi:diguanylate cyclase (GGDEF)-like protein